MDFGMPTLIEQPDTAESAALCRELGLRFLELNMSFPQYQPERMDPAALGALKEKYGIYYTAHIDESLDPCQCNPLVAGAWTETMLRAVALAKALEIPTLNLHLQRGVYVTLPERRTYLYAENEALYLEKLRAFRDRVTEAAAGGGVTVCVENTDGYEPFQLRGLDLLLESPVFGLTYDVGHDYAIGGADRPRILDRADRLRHMHLHDARGKKVHQALGDGEMDLPGCLALAREHGCRVVLETKTVAALRASVAWLKDHGEWE